MINKISLVNFSGDLVDFYKSTGANGARPICPSCGGDLQTYMKTGRLGCSVCYDTFHDEILRMVAQWK